VNPILAGLVPLPCSVLADDPNVNFETEELSNTFLSSPEDDPKVKGTAVVTGLALFSKPLLEEVGFVSRVDGAPNEKEGAGAGEEPNETEGAVGIEALSSR
jgi:hypothetical protein